MLGRMSRPSSKLRQHPLIFIFISDEGVATIFWFPLDDFGIVSPLKNFYMKELVTD